MTCLRAHVTSQIYEGSAFGLLLSTHLFPGPNKNGWLEYNSVTRRRIKRSFSRQLDKGEIKSSLNFDHCVTFLWLLVCVCRFNHELVFGVSVKNLSKAERLIYGDSLMTHAMILTAVTDKVRSHKPTLQECDKLAHTARSDHQEYTQSEFPRVLLCVYTTLICCSFS